jgi:long-chain acyl-CoA synthetase
MTTMPWLPSYREFGLRVTIPVDTHRSVVHLLDDAMARFAGRIAFRAADHSLTYADVDRLANDFCAWLQHAAGVRRGDRVAVMMPNGLAFPIALAGILRAGAVQVNVNPLYTARELEHQLGDAGCEVLVVFQGALPALVEALPRTRLRVVVTTSLGEPTRVEPATLPMATSFGAALAAGAALRRVPVEVDGDDLLFLQYTGGTTGRSKGAALTHRNLVANVAQFKAMVPDALREGEEVVVTAIPLYHIFALMVNFLTYFSVGAENWLVADPRDIDGLVDVMARARPTVFMGVNTLYAALTAHPRIHDVDFSRLRFAGGGGAAVVAATSEKWCAVTGSPIREGYGLSETSPVLTLNPMAVAGFTGTTGLPLPNTHIRLLDASGVDVPPGHAGEICVSGPQVMRGYWNQPEADALAFTPDGYFRTGDVGQFDERGFLKVVDRLKDMIIVSGFNVYPNEVEAVATECPGVLECACVGVPDDRTGEAVRLYVVKAAGATLTAEDVVAHCRRAMTAYKVPKGVLLVAALPKSPVGKILRRELRQVD